MGTNQEPILSPMLIGYFRLLELTYDMARRLEVSTESLHKNRLNALNGMNYDTLSLQPQHLAISVAKWKGQELNQNW